MSHLNCPACHSAMHVTADENLEFEQCVSCKGLWLDFGELKKIIELKKIKNFKTEFIHRGDDQIDHEHSYDCAACSTQMEQREYAYDSGIHLDICPTCKDIFISNQDLEEMVNFISSSEYQASTPERQEIVNKILWENYQSQIEKQKTQAKGLDDQFWSDDIISNRFFDWMFKEMTDVDSFPAVNQ